MTMLNKWKTKYKGKKGFTLIEMIVVIAIIAILIALLVPNIMKFIQSAKLTAANANAKMVFVAAQTYLTDEYTAGRPSDKAALGNSELVGYITGGAAAGTYTVTVSNGVAQQATWIQKNGVAPYGGYPVANTNADAATNP